jgi:hypothetical protein
MPKPGDEKKIHRQAFCFFLPLPLASGSMRLARGPLDNARIPPRLPMYFAIRRPVILSRSSLDLQVEHGEQCYVVDPTKASTLSRRSLRAEAMENWQKKWKSRLFSFIAISYMIRRRRRHLLNFYHQLVDNHCCSAKATQSNRLT